MPTSTPFAMRSIELHKNNWRLLRAAADSFQQGAMFGYLIGGQFVRGNQRGGGEYVNALEPDRARALQLLQQALPLVQKDPDHEAVAAFYLDFAKTLLTYRTGGNAWKLQTLTDLSKLPDYGPANDFGGSTVGASGRRRRQPGLLSCAGTLRSGQVRRRALALGAGSSRRILSGSQGSRSAAFWPTFCTRNSACRRWPTLAASLIEAMNHRPTRMLRTPSRSLKDDETIARLAPGIKRFKLPDEFNFLRIYREVATSGKKPQAEHALAMLAGIYENRRQYPRAAEVWRECIRRFGPGNQRERQARLDQIVGNWGSFEPTKTLPASAGADDRLPLPQRDAARTRSPRDSRRQAPRGRKSVPQVEPHFVRLERDQYRQYRLSTGDRESIAISRRAASPSGPCRSSRGPGTRTAALTSRCPCRRQAPIWLRRNWPVATRVALSCGLPTRSLVRKTSQKGPIYFVADAVTGQPIAGANVEFFGYKQLEAPRGRIRVGTLDFAETTDADGMAVPDPGDLKYDHQWIAIARGAGGHLAFLGFERIWWPRGQNVDVYEQNKVFAITDRPVYRPGQTMKFKFWVANARYDSPLQSSVCRPRIQDPPYESAERNRV